MKHIKVVILSLVAVIGLVTVLAPSYAAASTISNSIQSGVNAAGGDDTTSKPLKTQIKTVVNVMLFILGAIAVIMIVVGGIRYTTSGGDSSRVKASKDTIMYAIVGLVVALMAYAIVNFVISNLA